MAIGNVVGSNGLVAGASTPYGRPHAAGEPALRSAGDPSDPHIKRMVFLAFLVLLFPAALARATSWRWKPWPPGADGYGSIVGEARDAARAYVPIAFSGLL